MYYMFLKLFLPLLRNPSDYVNFILDNNTQL